MTTVTSSSVDAIIFAHSGTGLNKQVWFQRGEVEVIVRAALAEQEAMMDEQIASARKILARLCDRGLLTMSIPVRQGDEDMILGAVIDRAATRPTSAAMQPSDREQKLCGLLKEWRNMYNRMDSKHEREWPTSADFSTLRQRTHDALYAAAPTQAAPAASMALVEAAQKLGAFAENYTTPKGTPSTRLTMDLTILRQLIFTAAPAAYRCSECKAPLKSGYTCDACGSDEAEDHELRTGELNADYLKGFVDGRRLATPAPPVEPKPATRRYRDYPSAANCTAPSKYEQIFIDRGMTPPAPTQAAPAAQAAGGEANYWMLDRDDVDGGPFHSEAEARQAAIDYGCDLLAFHQVLIPVLSTSLAPPLTDDQVSGADSMFGNI